MGLIDQPCTVLSIPSSKIQSTPDSQHSLVSHNGADSDHSNGLDCDSLSDIIIDDLTDSEPTSAILSFCQRKFLLPYLNMLGLVGLRPISMDSSDWAACFSHIQTVVIVALISTGYFIQYLSCFRRDRGFTNTTYPLQQTPVLLNTTHEITVYYGESIFVYGVSSAFHFYGFLLAMYVFRIADNEQLVNLVERVFILSNIPNKLFYILWFHIVCGFFWLITMTSYIIIMEDDQLDVLKIYWFGKPTEMIQHIAKILLIVTTFCQDLMQIIVLTSYSIQCYLLRRYLFILKKRLLHNTIDPLDWMREMCEFRKLLSHLNKKMAMPVCVFTILNLSYTFSAIVYFIRIYNQFTNTKIVVMGLVNIVLWLVLALYPFFQAASLTQACESAQTCGHQVRIRPFVHHNTSLDQLNSVLLYASSLRLSAKLYRMPIHGGYVFFVIFCIVIFTLTLGMCLNISLGIL